MYKESYIEDLTTYYTTCTIIKNTVHLQPRGVNKSAFGSEGATKVEPFQSLNYITVKLMQRAIRIEPTVPLRIRENKHIENPKLK